MDRPLFENWDMVYIRGANVEYINMADEYLNSRVQHDFQEVFLGNGKNGGVFQGDTSRGRWRPDSLKKAFKPPLLPDIALVLGDQIGFVGFEVAEGGRLRQRVSVEFRASSDITCPKTRNRIMCYTKHLDNAYGLKTYDQVFNSAGKTRKGGGRTRLSMSAGDEKGGAKREHDKMEDGWQVVPKKKIKRRFGDGAVLLPEKVYEVIDTSMVCTMKPRGVKARWIMESESVANSQATDTRRMVKFFDHLPDRASTASGTGPVHVYDPTCDRPREGEIVNGDEFLFLEVGQEVSSHRFVGSREAVSY